MRANIGNTPSIRQRSVLEVPLWLHMHRIFHWVSLESRGKAEKRSNCEIGTNYCMNEGMNGRDGGIFHCM
jgi:hypothetical protein